MAAAIERIVVQVTPREKRAIMAKARRLGMPIAELMRRGATAYQSTAESDELRVLADQARAAADRAGASIDDALRCIEESNRRIAAMEASARRTATKASAR